MQWETFKFIIHHKEKFLYDNATAGGTDNSVDASAATVDPNHYLAPVIGGSGLMKILSIVALTLAILYLIKLNLKNG
jgi:hypothetical protein